jgi:hypothetical protein
MCCAAQSIVMDADGANRHRIEAPPGLAMAPMFWSPDATRLLGYACIDQCQLAIIALDGSAPPIVVPAPGNVGLGSWQPKGVVITAGSEVASATVSAS